MNRHNTLFSAINHSELKRKYFHFLSNLKITFQGLQLTTQKIFFNFQQAYLKTSKKQQPMNKKIHIQQ